MTSLSTDEVLERIQQQMEEVMATAQEVANSAVTNENEARQQVSTDDVSTADSSAKPSNTGSTKGIDLLSIVTFVLDDVHSLFNQINGRNNDKIHRVFREEALEKQGLARESRRRRWWCRCR